MSVRPQEGPLFHALDNIRDEVEDMLRIGRTVNEILVLISEEHGWPGSKRTFHLWQAARGVRKNSKVPPDVVREAVSQLTQSLDGPDLGYRAMREYVPSSFLRLPYLCIPCLGAFTFPCTL